jgi:hypothetical protein
MIPKETGHTSVPNSTYEVPKGTMKTRFEVIWTNIIPKGTKKQI